MEFKNSYVCMYFICACLRLTGLALDVVLLTFQLSNNCNTIVLSCALLSSIASPQAALVLWGYKRARSPEFFIQSRKVREARNLQIVNFENCILRQL